MKEKPVWNLALVGSGGDGVMTTANMLLKTAARTGLYGMMTQSYGPQIRGGEAAAHVTIGVDPVTMVDREKDWIVCFRFADAVRFEKEMETAKNTVVIHEAKETEIPAMFAKAKGKNIPIPFLKVLQEAGLSELAKNVFLFGILVRALGWKEEDGKASVAEMFSRKSSAVVSSNIRAFELGLRYMEQFTLPTKMLKPKSGVSRPVMTGNEACALASVAAGCRFYAGYPITPSSEILEEMNELLPKAGGKLIQAEDEIAALGMVIGASYGGVPSMTATSGPGLSLMTEMLGLSGIAEIPLVVVDCQRAGPSTGMPSRMEQSDFWHAVFGGHGDFPRVVLAPTDVRDCYQTMFRAFCCAENFQLPVIVLSDANIAQRAEVIDPVDTDSFEKPKRLNWTDGTQGYRRFGLDALISPMAFPGTAGGIHCIAGIEHSEKGMPSSDGAMHEAMNQKRFRKWEALSETAAGWHQHYGPPKAPHAIIAWGSSAAVAREFAENHPDFAVFVPQILHPFPKKALQHFLKNRKTVSVLEMNYQGQFYHYLKGIGAIDGNARSFKRSGGQPFHTEELGQMIQEGGVL